MTFKSSGNRAWRVRGCFCTHHSLRARCSLLPGSGRSRASEGASEPSWHEARAQDRQQPAVPLGPPHTGCCTQLLLTEGLLTRSGRSYRRHSQPVLGHVGRTSFGPKQTLTCSSGSEMPKGDGTVVALGGWVGYQLSGCRRTRMPTRPQNQALRQPARCPRLGPLAVTSADTDRGLPTAVPVL